jgi:hypothetical protein
LLIFFLLAPPWRWGNRGLEAQRFKYIERRELMKRLLATSGGIYLISQVSVEQFVRIAVE